MFVCYHVIWWVLPDYKVKFVLNFFYFFLLTSVHMPQNWFLIGKLCCPEIETLLSENEIFFQLACNFIANFPSSSFSCPGV